MKMQTLEEARKLNNRLHRRLQKLEGEWQKKVAKLEADLLWARTTKESNYRRMCEAYKELDNFKKIYVKPWWKRMMDL